METKKNGERGRDGAEQAVVNKKSRKEEVLCCLLFYREIDGIIWLCQDSIHVPVCVFSTRPLFLFTLASSRNLMGPGKP